MNINEKKITIIFASSVLLISTVLYLLTVAPTLLFWDCGEFITTSYIMGIPHPPGAPFYLMLGRIFSMIPFAEDIGLRVNLVSVFSSSFSVMFLYLTSVILIRKWRGHVKDIYDVCIVHASSAIGALTFAFTYTFWFSAVESEVYALSMLFSSIVLWLTLVWTEKHKDPDSTKYLLLMMLLVGLGTGVHLLNILTLPVSVFIMWHYNKRTAVIVGFGVILSIMALFAFPLDWKIYSLFVFIALTAVFQKMENNEDVSLMFIMPLLLILGYSTYIMIYLRAGLNPPINENDPSNWQRMLAYLNREQYGDEAQLKNAVTLFFGEPNRKYLESLEKIGAAPGSAGDPWGGHWAFFWKYQIVEMYIRYFNWQFIGMNINKLNRVVSLDGLYAIPFLAGLWGALHHFFKDRKKALALLALFIIMSLGLVIYQNQDYPQPRERDYFYVGSFFIFSIWIGMCITSVLEALKENQKLRKFMFAAAAAGLIIPALEINAHYHISDRTGNYVAWDYSHNILQSCEENAILFTNGDNDTFPVWYLQEVEGIRKDVQVINLSLLNTGWYIRQLKEKMPEYIKYTDRQIDEYFDPYYMTSEGFMRRYWPEKRKLQIPAEIGSTAPVEWELEPTMKINVQGSPEGFIKIQDQMVLEIAAYNAQMGWKRPIYFAVTVGSSNFIGLDDYMRMDGLCFRLVDYKAERGINPKVLYDRILGRYLPAYRNLDNPEVYYDDNILRMLQNYRSSFLQLAIYFDENSGSIPGQDKDGLDLSKNYEYSEFAEFSKNDKKRYILHQMEKILPASVIPYSNEMVVAEVAGMYADTGDKDAGAELISRIDVSELSMRKKMRFIMYLHSREFPEKASELTDGVLEEIVGMKNDPKKYDLFFELYAGFARLGPDANLQKIRKIISEDLVRNTDLTLRNSMFKEFGVLVYQGGDKEYSAEVFEEYLKLNPNDTEALDLLYQIYSIDGNNEKSLEVVDKYLEINPDDREYLSIRSKLKNEAGN